MVSHWLHTPVNGYLGSSYGQDIKALLHRPQADGAPGALLQKLPQPVVALPSTKQSLSMLSDAVDWSQVAACVANKNNCICYGHQAQRLNIVPDTCNAAINYGWIVTNKL